MAAPTVRRRVVDVVCTTALILVGVLWLAAAIAGIFYP